MESTRSSVIIRVIDIEQAGRRLDNVLLSDLKGAPKSLIYKLLRSGQVRVNGGRVKPDYRVAVGDKLRIPPVNRPAQADDPIPDSRLAQLRETILFEDDRYLVVNKPSGLSCHAGSGQRYGVIEIMRALRPDISRLDLGHRLDRETSGCLVLSKQLQALQQFHRQIRARDTAKDYQALLRGHPPAGLTRIDADLGISREAHGERRASVQPGERTAVTLITAHDSVGPHSLVTLRLETGRMHQIRAHARHIGYPVAGDREYGDAGFNRAMKRLGLKRLFLHATRVAFTIDGRSVDVTAELPQALLAVLDKLKTQGSGDETSA